MLKVLVVDTPAELILLVEVLFVLELVTAVLGLEGGLIGLLV